MVLLHLLQLLLEAPHLALELHAALVKPNLPVPQTQARGVQAAQLRLAGLVSGQRPSQTRHVQLLGCQEVKHVHPLCGQGFHPVVEHAHGVQGLRLQLLQFQPQRLAMLVLLVVKGLQAGLKGLGLLRLFLRPQLRRRLVLHELGRLRGQCGGQALLLHLQRALRGALVGSVAHLVLLHAQEAVRLLFRRQLRRLPRRLVQLQLLAYLADAAVLLLDGVQRVLLVVAQLVEALVEALLHLGHQRAEQKQLDAVLVRRPDGHRGVQERPQVVVIRQRRHAVSLLVVAVVLAFRLADIVTRHRVGVRFASALRSQGAHHVHLGWQCLLVEDPRQRLRDLVQQPRPAAPQSHARGYGAQLQHTDPLHLLKLRRLAGGPPGNDEVLHASDRHQLGRVRGLRLGPKSPHDAQRFLQRVEDGLAESRRQREHVVIVLNGAGLQLPRLEVDRAEPLLGVRFVHDKILSIQPLHLRGAGVLLQQLLQVVLDVLDATLPSHQGTVALLHSLCLLCCLGLSQPRGIRVEQGYCRCGRLHDGEGVAWLRNLRYEA
eukprot:scaffold442_cov268-Pinguiococcus_pyrenoidosus.AAC.107